MKKRQLEIESHLFESENGQFRATPFHELSVDEWVIYQNDRPKYLIDFNFKDSQFNTQIKGLMEQGFDLDEIIYKYGVYIGANWSIKSQINGKEIPNSQELKKVDLEIIDSFSEVANQLYFIALDSYDKNLLIDEDTMCAEYLDDDENGWLTLQTFFIDRRENIQKLIEFIFKHSPEMKILSETENVMLYDLTTALGKNIDLKRLEEEYQEWLTLSDRDNNMNEYGNLMDLISYLDRNANKKNLILRIEKKLLCPTLYKSNGGDSVKLNDRTNNKKQSWWKRMWS